MPSWAPELDRPTPEQGVVLRAMKVSDVKQVLQIEQRAFASPWKAEHFLHEIRDNPWAVNRVIDRGGSLLGYACVWCIYDELKINNIAIRGEERRRGWGRWLLVSLLDEGFSRGCRTATLEVRPSNVAARALYLEHGFVEIGRRLGYYAVEGEDAIVMSLDLDAARENSR